MWQRGVLSLWQLDLLELSNTKISLLSFAFLLYFEIKTDQSTLLQPSAH